MARDKHLSKEEELRLGGLVQSMLAAKERLGSGEEISAEEMLSLEREVEVGDQAVERLVIAYMGLVHSKARAFKTRYPGAPELNDLVQDGMAGLLTAIHRYDPARGNKVSTVASYWIFQAMTRATNKTGRLVKLPENRVTDFTRMSRLRATLEMDGVTGSRADVHIMAELGLSKDDIYHITNAAATPASLNKVVGRDSTSSVELIDMVPMGHAESSEDQVLKASILGALNGHLGELDEVERDLVMAAFLMEPAPGVAPLTPKEAREKHGLSPLRAKRALNGALEFIRSGLDMMGIGYEDFMD